MKSGDLVKIKPAYYIFYEKRIGTNFILDPAELFENSFDYALATYISQVDEIEKEKYPYVFGGGRERYPKDYHKVLMYGNLYLVYKLSIVKYDLNEKWFSWKKN